MSRNALAVGAIVVVGAALWMVTAWPAPGDDAALEPLEVEPVPGPAPATPQPAAVPTPPAEEPVQPPTAAPATAAPVPQPTAAPAAPSEQAPDMFAVEQGPVSEYRSDYESEPRDSAAIEVERTVRAAFAHPGDGAPDMFKSVLCRQTICRLELNYSEERMGAYIAGITRAVSGMDTNIAVAPTGPARGDTRPIEVFIKRQPTPSAAPGPQQPALAAQQPSAAPEQVDPMPSAAPEQAPPQPSAAPAPPAAN